MALAPFFLLGAHLAAAQIVVANVDAGNKAVPNLSAIASLKSTITQYKVDTWQTEQGLPQNTAQTLYQTRAGHLWVGTAGGLVRFDGIGFTTFETASADLAARSILGFMEDADGSLWIGHGWGAARYRDGQFESMFDAATTDGRRVWAFAQSRDGVVWAAGENGLIRWDNGKIKVYKEVDGLPTKRLRTLCFDRDGVLWIGTHGGGLVKLVDEKFVVLNPANGFPHGEVRHVIADPAGGVWAATAGGGLAYVNAGVIKTYSIADGLPTDQLTYLARDKAGVLWIGTWGEGVVRFSGGRFSTIGSSMGLGGDQVWSVLADNEGSIWVGTWNGGLNRLSNRAFGVFGKPEGLLNDNVRAVVHARDGAVWLSTAGGGVARLEGKNLTTITKAKGLSTNESSTLLEANDGAMWVGSYTQGISKITAGKIEIFGLAQGLPNVDVSVILQDRTGTIWAGTRSELARFDGQRFTAIKTPGAPVAGISTMLEGRDGALWIGTPGDGLFRYTPSDGVFKRFTRKEGLVSNWVLALYEDAAGALWIGTNGSGLNRLKDGKFTAVRTTDGLWDGTVQVILADKLGNIWMTCNRGFFRVGYADLNALAEGKIARIESQGFGPGDVLRSTSFAGGLQSAGSIDANGHLWLPSVKGVVVVDPSQLPGSGAPPRVAIEQALVNGVVRVVKKGAESAAPEDEIIVPPGAVPLKIAYTAAALLNADRLRFRYRLEGATPDWIDAGRAREAVFPALPHGAYRFRVAASLDGARWQEAAPALAIRVLPHYYQTSWFAALLTLAGLAAVFGVVRLRTHQLHTRHAEMARLVAEKTAALSTANAHLSRLSFTDDLTGLANRRSLGETLDTQWQASLKAQTSLGVVLIDIDAFKAFNDTLGHQAGDTCLVAVADVIREAVNHERHFAARYGGEEFIVVITHCNYAALTVFAENLRLACEARGIAHPASPVAAVVTISLGLAVCVPSAQITAEALIAQADAALYRAKKEGRNRVR